VRWRNTGEEARALQLDAERTRPAQNVLDLPEAQLDGDLVQAGVKLAPPGAPRRPPPGAPRRPARDPRRVSLYLGQYAVCFEPVESAFNSGIAVTV
jgi:hypothetical protein